MDGDSTAHAELREMVSLEEADMFVLGWKERIFYELDQMRREMPYADTLELRLTCRRRSD
jgi:hypothetical protein